MNVNDICNKQEYTLLCEYNFVYYQMKLIIKLHNKAWCLYTHIH